MSLSDPAQRYLASLLERATGQRLQPARSWRIDAALGPLMREREIDGLPALVLRLAEGRDPGLSDAVIDQLLNHETFFFRDAAVFQAIEAVALDSLRTQRAARRRLRIWCAGCSTGQEAYSLAMVFAAAEARWSGWSIEILGTDVSASAISRAGAGIYTGLEIQRGLPVVQMLRWFEPHRDEWRARVDLARRVRFQTHNLLDPPPAAEPFDLILCRNLLFYLGAERRRQAFQRLAAAIAPDGFLVLGAGETVVDQTVAFASQDAQRGFFRPTGQGLKAA